MGGDVGVAQYQMNVHLEAIGEREYRGGQGGQAGEAARTSNTASASSFEKFCISLPMTA